MAKESLREKTRAFASLFSKRVDDVRVGIDEGTEDFNKVHIARFARIIGFVILLSGILYFFSFLQKAGLI
jgi:hypothetical protein